MTTTKGKRGRLIGFDKFPHITGQFWGQPWCLTEDKLREIETVLRSRLESGAGTGFQAAGGRRGPPDELFQRVEDVAVVGVFGALTPRPSLFESGGTSYQQIGRAVDVAASDPTITSILLYVDSPGGSVFGLMETADKIAAARTQKNVVAVAEPMAASAAYWLASQANQLIVAPSGQVGSIGVIWAHTDVSRAEDMAGVKTTYIHAGKYKAEGAPEIPLTEDARNYVQTQIDSYYKMFTDAVARGRRVSPSRVLSDFGGGRMLLAADAQRVGMVDRVGTAEQVLAELVNGNGRSAPVASRGRARAVRVTTAPSASERQAELRRIAAMAAAAGVKIPTSQDPTEARRQFRAALVAKLATAGSATGALSSDPADQLRTIAVMAATAGVRVPSSQEPAVARRQLAVLIAAKLAADSVRDDAAKAATENAEQERIDRERAGKRPAAHPTTRAELSRAAQRAAAGLPTQ